MRRITLFAVLTAAVALACTEDDSIDGFVASPHNYQLTTPTTEIRIGQDSIVNLYNFGIRVVRDAKDTIPGPDTINQRLPRLSYVVDDIDIAYIDYNSNGQFGWIRGIKPGVTTLHIKGYGASLDVPVTVTAVPAAQVILRVLSGPAGGLIPVANRRDTGTFYALPAARTSTRLEGLVLKANGDTLFCNYCTVKTPNRVQRKVIFRSLRPEIALVTNAANPTTQRTTSGGNQANVDTVGYVTPFDTTSTPVALVMDVPGDGISDTVYVKFALRPIDTLRIMPDSQTIAATNPNDIGTQRIAYPGNELVGIAAQSGNTNYIVRVDFRAFVRQLPIPPSTTQLDTVSVTIRNFGTVNNFRPTIPIITWESALDSYLQINAAGAIIAPCSFITDVGCAAPVRNNATNTALARDSLVIKCVDNGKRLPGVTTGGQPVGAGIKFGGDGTLNFPTCPPLVAGGPAGPNIPTPGAYCTSAVDVLQATCSIWIRALAVDPVTGKQLIDRYRIEVRR